MCRVRGALLMVAVLSGCIRDQLVDCGNGIACPAGTACATIAAVVYCVPPADLASCDGQDPFAACTPSDGVPGACYEASPANVCLPSGCGNGLLDPGEICDDRNGVVGDGCSSNCLSNETCGNAIVDPVAGEQCDDGDLIGHDGCTSNCRPETPLWEQPVIGLPDPVFSQALAYDGARRRLVMYGGAFQQGIGIQVAHDQTWEWDGVAWMKMATPLAPSARFGHVMAYDPIRRKTVLFGGASSGIAISNETWEWDGSAWSYRPVASAPAPRYGAAAAYDPERKTVVVFGGSTGATDLDDQWEWDGTTWKQIPGPAPSARSGHGMTYDPVRGVMVVAGGSGTASPSGDTWERSAGVWSAVAATPDELLQPRLAFDGVGELAFGGRAAGTSLGNTWRWNGQSWTMVLPDAGNGGTPPPREVAGLARDPGSGRVVLVGGHAVTAVCGSCGQTRGDVWAWTGSNLTWKSIQVEAPTGRAFHAAAYDSLRGRTVVFGGGTNLASLVSTGETWELDTGHWSQRNVPGPAVRTEVQMAFDAAHGESVMFGGRNATGAQLDETWLWNGARWLQATPAVRPPAREGAAMAYDVARRRLVLFGGAAGSIMRGDTWEWDGTTWIQLLPAVSPPARTRTTAAYDPSRRRVVVFGGENPGVTYGDTWEWDGATWTELTSTQSPTARGHSALTWNSTRGSLTLFGGAAQVLSQFEDTWELVGGVWAQQFTATRPGLRQGHSLTPSSDGTGVLAFGGLPNTGSATAELWRLRWSTNGVYEGCNLDLDNDGDGLAGCDDPDCWARCTPLCPPGTTCDPSWPRCGDGVCNKELEDCRLCPQDCACTPVCGDTFCDPGETCPGDC